MTESAVLTSSKKLARAAELIGEARAERLVAADRSTALRLELLTHQVGEEAEVLDGVARHQLPMPERATGASFGALLRHDATTRANRRAAGLSIPEVEMT